MHPPAPDSSRRGSELTQSATTGYLGTLRSVRGGCERRAAPPLSPEGEVHPTATDANVGSMKAPIRVADVDVGGCRRGALRSGEQRWIFIRIFLGLLGERSADPDKCQDERDSY